MPIPSCRRIRAMMLFVVAVYVGTMYPRLNHTTANLTEMSGAAFFNVWCVLFAVISATPSFVVDRRVALEEMLNGAYGPATHCLAQFVASMPFTAASAFIYQAIFHFIVGFNDSFESYMFASLLTITLLLMMEVRSQRQAGTPALEKKLASAAALRVMRVAGHPAYRALVRCRSFPPSISCGESEVAQYVAARGSG
ncbi:unnamed protein product [Phaeothamnion confervicola]